MGKPIITNLLAFTEFKRTIIVERTKSRKAIDNNIGFLT